MKILYSPAHALHQPKAFLKAGLLAPNPEVAARATVIAASLEACGFELVTPSDHGLDPLISVHNPELVHFLSSAHGAWMKNPLAGPEILPNVHPGARFRHRPQSVVGQAGYFMQDTACPISAGTWDAVVGAANAAVEAAASVGTNDGRAAFALCRPPGHHATRDQAGGFCYLNNAAIAAQALCDRFQRVAIIDVDVHHGNGTQDIFYDRGDVFFTSIHGHPDNYYPFFSGTAAERGEGAGLECNYNVPFPVGSGDAEVMHSFRQALASVRDYAPEALVVSLGFDAHEKDPHGGHRVSTAAFLKMSEALSALGLPTVLVQEGGYLHDELGDLACSFLKAFDGAG